MKALFRQLIRGLYEKQRLLLKLLGFIARRSPSIALSEFARNEEQVCLRNLDSLLRICRYHGWNDCEEAAFPQRSLVAVRLAELRASSRSTAEVAKMLANFLAETVSDCEAALDIASYIGESAASELLQRVMWEQQAAAERLEAFEIAAAPAPEANALRR